MLVYDYKKLFGIIHFTLYLILLIKNNAIALRRANNSKACPEFPRKKWTNANIIQTTNQTKTSIVYSLEIFFGSGIPTLLYPAST